MDLKDYIREVQDFPIEGIGFKDITTVLADGSQEEMKPKPPDGSAPGLGAKSKWELAIGDWRNGALAIGETIWRYGETV